MSLFQSTKKKKSALLVEDSVTIAKMLIPVLESGGYAVTHVVSGTAALDAIMSASQPDVVILDNLLAPDAEGLKIDGIELLDILRSHGVSLPIIFFTGDKDSYTIIEAFRLGATDYIVKPMHDADNLLHRLEMMERKYHELSAKGVITWKLSAMSDNQINDLLLRIEAEIKRRLEG